MQKTAAPSWKEVVERTVQEIKKNDSSDKEESEDERFLDGITTTAKFFLLETFCCCHTTYCWQLAFLLFCSK